MSEIDEDLKRQVLKALLGLGEAMTSADIFQSSDLASEVADVSRVLADLRREGLVALARKKWSLVDASKARKVFYSGENNPQTNLVEMVHDTQLVEPEGDVADLLERIRNYKPHTPIEDLEIKLQISQNLGDALANRIGAETARELTEHLHAIRDDLMGITGVTA